VISQLEVLRAVGEIQFGGSALRLDALAEKFAEQVSRIDSDSVPAKVNHTMTS
jgi:hypothetical protein